MNSIVFTQSHSEPQIRHSGLVPLVPAALGPVESKKKGTK
jgi:hypothetical protein